MPLIGYPLRQTLSEHGTVNRGNCATDASGRLIGIDEVLKIERIARWRAPAIRCRRVNRVFSRAMKLVSMTCFGLCPGSFGQLRGLFAGFLARNGQSRPRNSNLPVAVGSLLQSGSAEMRVLRSGRRMVWGDLS